MGPTPAGTAAGSASSGGFVRHLDRFFTREAPVAAGEGVLVAFSGGPDSCALLWGMAELARRRELRLLAVHCDHGLDPGSNERACRAIDLAARLGVPCARVDLEVGAHRRPAESIEAAARRRRYLELERVRREQQARWLATAHHRDDQAETVLLRLLFGSGLAGLAGIRPRQGALVRPLLAIRRRSLAALLGAAGVAPLRDPTNEDLAVPRNRVRHLLLPHLAATDHDLVARLARLAEVARGAAGQVDALLAARLEPTSLPAGAGIDLGACLELPEPLRGPALALLHRAAGADHPPPAAARRQLFRQLALRFHANACDAGGGWRWEVAASRLTLARRPLATGLFTYTLDVPGELIVPDLRLRMRLTRVPVESWMFRGEERRAALALPLEEGGRVTIRNRRPGDRIQPLGAPGHRRLKDVFNARRVPRHERDRRPLLCLGEQIAWVPGVTIDHAFRLRREPHAWVAEIEPL